MQVKLGHQIGEARPISDAQRLQLIDHALSLIEDSDDPRAVAARRQLADQRNQVTNRMQPPAGDKPPAQVVQLKLGRMTARRI